VNEYIKKCNKYLKNIDERINYSNDKL